MSILDYNPGTGMPVLFGWKSAGGRVESIAATLVYKDLLASCCTSCSLAPAPKFCRSTDALDLVKSTLGHGDAESQSVLGENL